MSETLKALGEYVATEQAQCVVKHEVVLGELTFIARPEFLHPFIEFLRGDTRCQCQQLVDICGADYPERAERFEVVYNLLSLKLNHRIRVKVCLKEDAAVDSIVDLYSMAGWFERETWDLYGIPFTNNPDLRRILTDYGFVGHPLRKDFPLTGFVELRYDETEKRIVSEPVKLPQDFRNFDFASPWEGMMTMQTAGDAKDRKPKVGAK